MTASDNEKRTEGWRTVELPENLVVEIEQLMKEKHEKRPVQVPLGLFIGDLIRDSLKRAEVQEKYFSILEDYAVEPECIYIRDNNRDVIAELRFKDGTDLYCNVDGAKNCVHVGFAWSLPAVQKLLWNKSKNLNS